MLTDYRVIRTLGFTVQGGNPCQQTPCFSNEVFCSVGATLLPLEMGTLL